MQWKSWFSPVYATQDGSVIDCMLTLADGRVLPFSASRSDPMPYGSRLYAAIVAGPVRIMPYTPPAQPPQAGDLPIKFA